MATKQVIGRVDQRTLALGSAYERRIRKTQTAVWASVAAAEHETQARHLRRQHANSGIERGRFSVPHEGWWALPGPRQARYLDGQRHPQKRMIDGVAKHAPVSYAVYHSFLWPMLSPKTDLKTCVRKVAVFGKTELDILVRSLLAGEAHSISRRLEDLDTVATLVAHVRVLVDDKKVDEAFDAGRALTQMLCYHAVHPLFSVKASMLWDLVAEGVLADLRNKGFAFSRCREGFEGFTTVLWSRLQSVKSLFGIHRLASGPELSWSATVELSEECICGFSTPDFDRPDALQSFLDADKYLGRRASELLDRDPLFIPVRR